MIEISIVRFILTALVFVLSGISIGLSLSNIIDYTIDKRDTKGMTNIDKKDSDERDRTDKGV